MRIDERQLPLALLGVTLLWCLALALVGAHEGLLYLAPALLLAAPLAVRRYVGEKAVLALVRSPKARSRPVRRQAAPPRSGHGFMPRGTLLLATSLSGRPPPAR